MPRTLLGRAQLVVVALAMVVAAAILDAYAHAHRFALVEDSVGQQLDGVVLALPQDTADRADAYVSAALIGTTVTIVLGAAAWILWQVTAARRAEGRIDGWRGEPRTGALVWFAPVVNLVAPVLVLASLVRAFGRPAPFLLAGWWAAWIGSAALAPFATRDTEVLADQRLPDALAIGSDVLLVVSAILAIGVVRRITDGALELEERAALAATASPDQAASA